MYWLPALLILPYFFLLSKIYRDLLRIRQYNAKSAATTYISLIIACRNEEDQLPQLLSSISLQDYPKELFEVIIVDDNSDDNTVETVSEHKGSLRLIVIQNKGKGKKEAIRTGINASSGSLILTTDADCTMGKSWLRTIASFFEEHRPDLIICPVNINSSGGLFGRFQELEYLGLQGITAGTALAGNGVMCNGANLAYTREAYLRNMAGMHFEVDSGDDVFLLHSIKKETDSKILWLESADALVTTSASQSLSSFFKQRSRWISKWKFYDDKYTNCTGIITFSAVLLQLFVLIALISDFSFIWLFSAILILKSLPECLIIDNTSKRYGGKNLFYWFLPAQLIYPVYVLAVFLASLVSRRREKD